MNLPSQHKDNTHYIHKKLTENNFIVYLAGGCVRDTIINRQPYDIDFATNAKPDEVENIFEHTSNVGKSFGTITVKLNSIPYEITTFRKDYNYDGRHPSRIEFGDPKSDALRRDFTCNALFFDLTNNKVIDYVDGIQDIQKKIIRAVGDPIERFTEDKLRILRAIRFSCQLNWKIEEETFKAIKTLNKEIKNVSKERFEQEFHKIIMSNKAEQGIKTLSALIPEDFVKNDVKLSGDLEARLAILLRRGVIKEYFCNSKKIKKTIDELCNGANKDLLNEELYTLRNLVLTDWYSSLIDILKSENRIKEIELLTEIKKKYPYEQPLINGDDLKALPISNTKFAEVLTYIRKAQLNCKISTKQEAITLAKKQFTR